MPNVYIEPRPKGRADGVAIADFVVEDHAGHVLSTHKTQEDAIAWAKARGHDPLIARVRHTDRGTPGHWRST
jgi:hypothetical protein